QISRKKRPNARDRNVAPFLSGCPNSLKRLLPLFPSLRSKAGYRRSTAALRRRKIGPGYACQGRTGNESKQRGEAYESPIVAPRRRRACPGPRRDRGTASVDGVEASGTNRQRIRQERGRHAGSARTSPRTARGIASGQRRRAGYDRLAGTERERGRD